MSDEPLLNIEIDNDKFKVRLKEFPICKCGGIIIPVIIQNYVFGSYDNRKGGPELNWKCSTCGKEIK